MPSLLSTIREWLTTWLASSAELSPKLVTMLAIRIGVAFALGVVVAALYRWARRGESTTATFPTTLVLLTGLIAMATQVIGDNTARAFSMVGALSVVRFRTVVKDTQDTAFVILAVVVGMSSGASELAVGLVGLAILGLVAPLLWPPNRLKGWGRDEAMIRFKIEGSEVVKAAVDGVFQESLASHRLVSAATAKKGAALELAYAIRIRPGGSPLDLIAELNRIEGVSGVEISREL